MSEWGSSDTMWAGGQQPNQMRSALADAGGWEPWCTPVPVQGGWEPAHGDTEGWDTAGGTENDSSSGSATVHNVTMADEDIDILECGICYHPLKPPIFQCTKGHVVCSPCSKRLKDAVSCHVCRVAMPGGYQRCHAMERVVDSVRMPCPHAPYGCNKRIVYHAREEHLQECPHAPCHCPGDFCGFVGSVERLIRHIKRAHSWPCTTEVCVGNSFSVYLRIGFNFLIVVRGSTECLLLLNMASTPFGHAISAVWIQSLATMAVSSSAQVTNRNTTCELKLVYSKTWNDYQVKRFKVECMCPSKGLPDPNTSFQFFVPECAGGNEAPVHVTVTIEFSSDQADGSWDLK